MNFEDLTSEETIKSALNWISECIQGAMIAKEPFVNFTFKPTENNPLDAIFDFVLSIKEYIIDYGFAAWVVLDNKNQLVNMRIVLEEQRRN